MKYKISVMFFLLLLAGMVVMGQSKGEFVWHDPAKEKAAVIEGQAWPGEVASRYDRLPARAEGLVRKEVWDLSRQAAGLMIRFSANTDQVRVRYGVGGSLSLPHMPSTGVSGVDLYAVDCDGSRLWCWGSYGFKDTVEYKYVNLRSDGVCGEKEREYHLYLPLYNSVKWLEIGVPDSGSFHFLPMREQKPIVIYGTSITQGACASRPGMAWTSILGRTLDYPVVNLGFSGNGRLEKEVVDLVKEIDARVYVLDCLPNLIGRQEADVKERVIAAVAAIRQKSKAPILLVEHAGYTDGGINRARMKLYKDVNIWMEQVYDSLKRKEGKLYLLKREQIDMGQDMMVDGTHPTDMGMQRYADAYAKMIGQILRKS